MWPNGKKTNGFLGIVYRRGHVKSSFGISHLFYKLSWLGGRIDVLAVLVRPVRGVLRVHYAHMKWTKFLLSLQQESR